jgi:hypothetical protein
MEWSASERAPITIIALCQVATMALWFSASAVIPSLVAEFALSPASIADRRATPAAPGRHEACGPS